MFGLFLKNSKQVTEELLNSQVGCFGKLPIYDEFIRHNVCGRPVIELDEWIQQGYSHHSRVCQTRHDKTELHNYTYHYVFSGKGAESSTVIGTLMGSHDKAGRQYPFVIFKILSNQDTENLESTLPCAYRPFYENALTLCTTDLSLQPINMLKKRVNSLNVGGGHVSRSFLMEAEVNALEKITREEFWDEMLGESDKDKAPLYIEVMRELLATVARKSPLRTSWGIEIPLPAKKNNQAHVSFWLRMAQIVLGNRGWRPHYIWGDINNAEKQSLYIFFRPVTPIFFSHLLGHRVDNGVLINLEKESVAQSYVHDKSKTIGSLNTEDNIVSAINEWAEWGRS